MTRTIESLTAAEVAEITDREAAAGAAHDAATKRARADFPNFRQYPAGYCAAIDSAAAEYVSAIAAIAADYDLENPN